jgi:hypothetical protein
MSFHLTQLLLSVDHEHQWTTNAIESPSRGIPCDHNKKTSVDFYSIGGFRPKVCLLYEAISLLPPTEYFQAYSLRFDDNIFFCVCQRISVDHTEARLQRATVGRSRRAGS